MEVLFRIGALALLASLIVPAMAGAVVQLPADVPLTDGRTFAYWGHPEHRSVVRQLPDANSRQVARLHYYTEDGFPEVYPVMRRATDAGGGVWLKIGIPKLPGGRTGWVRESALGPLYRVTTRLVINRHGLRATLFRSGHRLWKSRIGIGKASTPTLAGAFWIREKFKVSNPAGIYGPRAFGTSSYSHLSDWPGGGVIGIHGTNQPSLIPGRPSHGCIRIPNSAILRLYRLMPIGTPMVVV